MRMRTCGKNQKKEKNMKKSLLALAALLLLGGAAQAQPWSFGPKAGVAFSSINGVENARARTGVVAGAFVESAILDWFSIQGELLYSQQGFDTKIDGVKTECRLDYIAMPVVAKIYLIGGLNLQVGAQAAYLINAKEQIGEGPSYGIKNEVNHYNVGVLTGMAYDFNFGLFIEGRYHYSLTNTFNTIRGQRGGALQVMVGWKF